MQVLSCMNERRCYLSQICVNYPKGLILEVTHDKMELKIYKNVVIHDGSSVKIFIILFVTNSYFQDLGLSDSYMEVRAFKNDECR